MITEGHLDPKYVIKTLGCEGCKYALPDALRNKQNWCNYPPLHYNEMVITSILSFVISGEGCPYKEV